MLYIWNLIEAKRNEESNDGSNFAFKKSQFPTSHGSICNMMTGSNPNLDFMACSGQNMSDFESD